jgi:hypoxanthine phosphoribosyltransferase
MNKLVINNDQLKSLVAKICRDITLSGWRPEYVVGLTRGGLTPAVMISHYFNVPCETLKVSLRAGGEPESNLWMAEDAFGYTSREIDFFEGNPMELLNEGRAKEILIVDDINDSGATINWIMKDWPSGCLPDDPVWKEVWNNNVRFAVLVDNLASKCDAKMDYVGMEINKAENDVWVDFPWEDWWAK